MPSAVGGKIHGPRCAKLLIASPGNLLSTARAKVSSCVVRGTGNTISHVVSRADIVASRAGVVAPGTGVVGRLDTVVGGKHGQSCRTTSNGGPGTCGAGTQSL